VIRGRIHINGQMNVSLRADTPTFLGYFTQTEETINGLTEGPVRPGVPGGLPLPLSRATSGPPTMPSTRSRRAHTAAHTFEDSVYLEAFNNISAPLTTRIRLQGRQYRTEQYVPPFFMANVMSTG
jgi:hypothetical protein